MTTKGSRVPYPDEYCFEGKPQRPRVVAKPDSEEEIEIDLTEELENNSSPAPTN